MPQPPQFIRSVVVFTQPPLQLVRPARHGSPVQTPIEHTWAPVHALPHAPQLAGSLGSDEQRLPQAVCPIGHESTQVPSMQTWAREHALPQEPQLSRSVRGSTQVRGEAAPPSGLDEHTAYIDAHSSTHAPDEHTSPPVHAWPHEPQLFRSVITLAQIVPQRIWLEGQPAWHAPPTQTCPASHAAPQLPQLSGSLW